MQSFIVTLRKCIKIVYKYLYSNESHDSMSSERFFVSGVDASVQGQRRSFSDMIPHTGEGRDDSFWTIWFAIQAQNAALFLYSNFFASVCMSQEATRRCER